MLVGSFCAAVCTAALSIQGPVYLDGRQIGEYVDDQEPNQCQVVADDLSRWPLVIAGVSQFTQHGCPGAINALEQYPRHAPYRVKCGWSAYILPRSFHWPGTKPYTRRQQKELLRSARACGAKVVIFY